MAVSVPNSGTPGRSRQAAPMPVYEIYSGRIHDDPILLESVYGLGNAYELMTKIATKTPGRYFIACARTSIVQGTIDTSAYFSHDSETPRNYTR